MIDPLRVAIAVLVVIVVLVVIAGVVSLTGAIRMKRMRDNFTANDPRERRPWW